MLIAVIGSLRQEVIAVDPVLLDEGVQPEPAHPIDQTVGW
jgi:hypothetical protein